MAGVGAVAIAVAGKFARQARVSSLHAEVECLNDKIARFIDLGGCLDGIRGVEPIIDALKSGGGGIGSQFSVTMQTEVEAATDEARAIWDPRQQRLVVTEGGEVGARRFNDSAAAGPMAA